MLVVTLAGFNSPLAELLHAVGFNARVSTSGQPQFGGLQLPMALDKLIGVMVSVWIVTRRFRWRRATDDGGVHGLHAPVDVLAAACSG